MTALIQPPNPALVLSHIECRALGHQWRHEGVIGIDDTRRRPFNMSGHVLGYRSVCGNCGMERIKWVTRSGEVINRYTPPEGYQHRGEERLSSLQWRQQFAVRLFEGFDTPAKPRRARRAS